MRIKKEPPSPVRVGPVVPRKAWVRRVGQALSQGVYGVVKRGAQGLAPRRLLLALEATPPLPRGQGALSVGPLGAGSNRLQIGVGAASVEPGAGSAAFPQGSWPTEALWLARLWVDVAGHGPNFWRESVEALSAFSLQDNEWAPECALALQMAQQAMQEPEHARKAAEMVALCAFCQQVWLATQDPEKGAATRADPGFDAFEENLLRYAQCAPPAARMMLGFHWGARRLWGHTPLSQADFSQTGAWGARIAQLATAQWESIALQAQMTDASVGMAQSRPAKKHIPRRI